MSSLIKCRSKVGGSRGIYANSNGLIFNPPEEPSHLSQLLPSRHLILVPHPQRIADPLNLDAQVGSARVMRGQRRQRPIRSVRCRAHRRGMACVVAKLQAHLHPFGSRRRRDICGWCSAYVSCNHPRCLPRIASGASTR